MSFVVSHVALRARVCSSTKLSQPEFTDSIRVELYQRGTVSIMVIHVRTRTKQPGGLGYRLHSKCSKTDENYNLKMSRS